MLSFDFKISLFCMCLKILWLNLWWDIVCLVLAKLNKKVHWNHRLDTSKHEFLWYAKTSTTLAAVDVSENAKMYARLVKNQKFSPYIWPFFISKMIRELFASKHSMKSLHESLVSRLKNYYHWKQVIGLALKHCCQLWRQRVYLQEWNSKR